MSVAIRCPNCSCEHLHASVAIEAEAGDRFEVIGSSGDGEDNVVVRVNRAGRVQAPSEALLSCCACDWSGDTGITWATE